MDAIMVNRLNLEGLNIIVLQLFVIFHLNKLEVHNQVDKLKWIKC